MTSNYERAGIHDIAAFYADKFVDASHGRDYYGQVLHRHSSMHARFRWFDRHVRPGTTVLDFGCGAGTLSFLVQKGCRVFGIELSPEGARKAKAAGYEDVFVGDVSEAADGFGYFGYFDYVVSEDVLGHIEFDHKDHVLASLKRMLKPEGVMLHAIECGDIDYDGMSDDEIRAFVSIDGHVGMESRSKILARFRKLFAHTDGEVRFVHCNTAVNMLKESADYAASYPPELMAYIAQMGATERQAFDIANGIVFHSLEALETPSDDRAGGLMMLRAADVPLPDVEYEHLAFRLLPPQGPGSSLALDSAWMLAGWHATEQAGSGLVRWTEQWAVIRVPVTDEVRSVEIHFTVPGASIPCRVRFGQGGVDDVMAECEANRTSSGVDVSRSLSLPIETPADSFLNLRIETDRVHIPAWTSKSDDDRRLGVCVRSVRLL